MVEYLHFGGILRVWGYAGDGSSNSGAPDGVYRFLLLY